MMSKWDDCLRAKSTIEKTYRSIYRKLEARNAYLARRLTNQQHQLTTASTTQLHLEKRLRSLERLHNILAFCMCLEFLLVMLNGEHMVLHLKEICTYGEEKLQWLGSIAHDTFIMVTEHLTTISLSNFIKNIN